MDGPKVVFEIPGTNWVITETLVIGWILIALIFVVCLILTSNLKKVPETKRQVIAEMLVNFVNGMVIQTMGVKFKKFAPYIATLLIFAVTGSLVSMFGLRSMTADLNVTLCWAIMTFVLITYYKFKANGFIGYFKTFGKPVAFIAPLNVISEVATPMSMAFRLFGNVAGGMVITSLLYTALGTLSRALHLSFSIGPFTLDVASLFVPAVLSAYFDLFSGCVQAYIFSMLTMVYVSSAAEE